ncbi:Lrp/AsnC family transcriptional regulator [Dichelobacter nodosus]|uniref:AsnC family transcriptional regulator n=1 Tax=Dichelobacter nodosus (strain VCS1703A) TaxID=246195 RepID=A5EVS6_DICNV|nr:Lrp/AsnC family transcriptional regulator [Dichelobacter nodosus]ABQ13160.1 AsnC family transcriptional regulator [Dichelobacter nodosus VCS1703A]AXM45353.1 Lrp/AsnC family transcriptional regulator [Dichelobacter nodosus]KNZ39374.1 AsnC family transcriptional regulator [Dichelobacter nodosus]TGA65033.1 Lrp/AsnC family transcriptional regulator [Dichelobacter nodosus]
MSDKTQFLDEIDKRILEILSQDGRINNLALAQKVNLSPTPCARRVKRLEEQGVIDGYMACLNHQALGFPFSAFVAVTMDQHTPDRYADFERTVEGFPEVVRMSVVTGRSEDYLLQVVVKNMAEYESFLLGRLNRIPGVANVHSSFEMRRIIDRQPKP